MSRLGEYRRKRNFAVTPEPKGGRAARVGGRFVVQRHSATRLHYDLRLELGGVYKSWAVTKVPSLDPAVKRLAVEVEDHPLEYGSFEGTIPKGEYGGGTVQLWDRGRWRAHSSSPARDLKAGHLTFELDGVRMKGGWALVRLRDRGTKPGRAARNNWLLIKERDAAAGRAGALARKTRSVKTGRTLAEIAADKPSRKTMARKKRPAGKKR